jgi:hypothetical protein
MSSLHKVALVGAIAIVGFGLSGEAATLRTIAEIPIPGAAFESYDTGIVIKDRLYLADRSNKSLDVFDIKANKFLTMIPGFVGAGSSGLVGPNGMTTVDNGRELWVADGDSTIKIVDVAKGQIVDSVSTGGKKRVHAVAYDEKDGIFIVGNDADEPNFLTLISTKPGHTILGKIPLPRTDGTEQPLYRAANGMFYIALPQLDNDEHKGGIAIVDPRNASLVKIVEIQNCRPQGLAQGRGNFFVLGCNAGSKASKLPPMAALFDAEAEKLLPISDRMGGADIVDYSKTLGLYVMGGREAPDGPSVALFDAESNKWIENIIIPPNPHSVTVDESSGHIFVPSGVSGPCKGCLVVLGK